MGRFLRRTAFGALLLAGTAAQAATVPPLAFTQRTLPNGLRVYAMPDRGGATVSVQMWYDVGGRNDPTGRSGFAHLFEHLMFKATRNMPPEAMMRLTEDVGGDLNASTDDDYTEFHEVAPASQLQRLLWGEAERMGSLVVDEPTFVAERHVVEEELRGDAARPYDSLFRIALPRASYGVSPYARSPIGSIPDLDSAMLEDVRAFHALYYRPDNAVLVVAGNFDPAALDRWMDGYFGKIARPSWPIPRAVAAEPARTAPHRYTLTAANIPLPAVLLSWQLPPATDPDHAAITVLDAILSAGESARLNQDLVYRDQIASQAGTSTDFRKGTGIFCAYAVLANGGTAAQAETALRAEVARLRDAPVSAEELVRVRNQVLIGALKQRETAEGRAAMLAEDVVVEGDPHASDRLLAAIRTVGPADVRRVARRLLADDRAVTIHYLPAGRVPAADTIPVAATVATSPLVAPPDVPVVAAASPSEREQPPAPGAPVAPTLPHPIERRLENGLRLVLAERPGLPIVTTYLVTGLGSATDPAGRAGLAGLAATLMTKGTATRSASEIARAVETLGGSIGADAGRDGATLALTVGSEQLAPAMAVFADAALHPGFVQPELDLARKQVIDGLAVSYSEPGSLAPIVASRLVYGAGPYGAPADGTPASLRAITRADVTAAYRKWWRPDAATLVMVGDIDEAKAVGLARSLFGGWRAPAAPLPMAPSAGALPPPRTVVIDLPDAPQAAVMVARATIARGDPRYYTMLVADEALGGGFGARLNQEIRVRRGLAYGASASFGARRSPAPLAISTQTKNPTVPEVVSLIGGEMRRMGAEPVPAAELDARKASLTGGFGRAIETTDGLAGLLARLTLAGVPPEEVGRYTAAVNGVTPEQVLQVSRQLIDPSPASTVVVGDAKQFLPGLRATGVKVDVIPGSALDLDAPAPR